MLVHLKNVQHVFGKSFTCIKNYNVFLANVLLALIFFGNVYLKTAQRALNYSITF